MSIYMEIRSVIVESSPIYLKISGRLYNHYFQILPDFSLSRKNSRLTKEVKVMTLCPVALAVGCEKCLLFKACPLKTTLGDQKQKKEADKKEKQALNRGPSYTLK